MATSPVRSMSGWSFFVWLQRNKDSLKTLAAALFGALGAWVASVNIPEVWAPVAAVAVGVASKMALDAIDFWLSSVEVP